MSGMSFTVDPWDPGYGQAFAEEQEGGSGGLSQSTAELNLDLEVPAGEWRPLDPDPSVVPPGTVLFLDGVRRIDARVWVHGGGLQPVAGIAASLAAGIVVCNGGAHVADVVVERGLFTAAGDAGDLVTRCGRYAAYPAADGAGLDKLSQALQQRLAFAEVELAVAFRGAHPGDDDLLIVDGPLHGRAHLERTIGYVKTHHASYLPGDQAAVVGALKPGQRTPAFTMGTSWERASWYLQLPGTDGVPWSGVVRLECSADLDPKDISMLADQTTRVLPAFASVPHKDPRAPQNLVPIGGLERQLKHRLGDERLLYRALRAASLTQFA